MVAFAYQRPAVYLETNVRSVFLHELFPEEEAVSDKVLLPLVEAAAFHPAAAADPRRWYYGLLDYGAHLKATVPNPSRRSAGHSRQSAFEGSRRPEAGLDHPPRARRSRGRLPRGRARRPEHG